MHLSKGYEHDRLIHITKGLSHYDALYLCSIDQAVSTNLILYFRYLFLFSLQSKVQKSTSGFPFLAFCISNKTGKSLNTENK